MKPRPLIVLLLLTATAHLGAQMPDADRAQLLMRQGAAMMQENKPELAEPLFRQSTTLAPTNALAFYHLGTAEMMLDKHVAALEAMEKALKLDAATPGLLRRQRREAIDIQGLCYASMKEYGKAMTVYADAIAKDPDYPGFAYNQACVCALAGDRKAALSSLYRALALDARSDPGPTLPDASADEDLKGLWGDPIFQAILFGSQRPQPNDGPGGGLARQGAKSLATGDLAGGVELLTAGLEADPNMVRGWFVLGGALDATGKPSEAADAFRKALALNVGPRAVLSKAQMRYAALYAAKDLTLSGKYQEAADALRVADKAEPYYAPTFYQLALVFAGAGDMGEAQGALQRAFGLKGQMSPLDPRLPDPSKDPAFSKWAGDKAWNDFLAGLPR